MNDPDLDPDPDCCFLNSRHFVLYQTVFTATQGFLLPHKEVQRVQMFPDVVPYRV